jgi:hypothetical protein
MLRLGPWVNWRRPAVEVPVKVTDLPFNRVVGLRASGRPELGALELEDSPRYHNHLETVHASAQFALAAAAD